ncbi:MAG: O-antigen ligase family protein, partial [Candidatus Latescibacterota bacterium]
VLLGLMAFMLRFDLVYSVYLFTILFPFPSGVSVGSTNSILMTLIPLIWMVRAASTKSAIYFKRTKVDFAIALFLFTYVLSFINVETTEELRNSLRVFWRTAATVMFFYTIVTFVNDEKKIFTLVKISCSVCGFLMFTALLEFFMPGQSIIPGWIGFSGRAGMGEIGFRIEGMRVGGALKSQAMMADFASRTLFLLIFLTIKTRNYFEKTIWAAIGVMCLVTIAATANRGAVTSVSIAGIYLYYLFRKQISIAQVLVLMGAIAMLLALSEVTLTRYTNAVSLSDRLRGTYFTGAIPDSRKNTWKPAFRRSLEHPFIGHGPYYDIGEGLTYKMWPHNGLIFYFYTIGLFGLMAFLAVVYQVWKYTLSYKLPHVRGSPLADLSKVLGAVLVATAVQQMRTDHQREDIYPYMIWFIFGLIATTGIVLEELSKKRANQEPEPGGGGVAEGAKRRLRRQPLKRLRS